MPKITPQLAIALDVSQPVPELCAVIAAVLQYHPQHEQQILTELRDAIDTRLKEAMPNGQPILQPDAECKDQG